MIELLLKTVAGGSWLDGMVIAAKPKGQWITKDEIAAFYAGGDIVLTCYDAANWLKILEHRRRTNNEDLLDAAETHGGFDTAWGLQDLTQHAVIFVDATFEQIAVALQPKTTLIGDRLVEDRKRSGVVEYWRGLSEETVARMRTVTFHTPHRDVAPLPFGELWQPLL